MITPDFWKGRKVLITGHTGFKGAWLSLWLQEMGARVTGYSLEPPTRPSLFDEAALGDLVDHHIGDIRDLARMSAVMQATQPDIVLHLAAQPLVRLSYDQPVETYTTNVIGTVHVLEAVRHTPSVRAVVCITSDKSYENREWEWGYRENEAMGGYDPYSSSKGCSELVISAYRRSYFPTTRYQDHGVAVASARAGNVIGGGDWALDRLVPDIMRALEAGKRPLIRNPKSIRPWQHVLDALCGYLVLAQRLRGEAGDQVAEGWNFGPHDTDARPVDWICDELCRRWGAGAGWDRDQHPQQHEATYLKLDISKARHRLGWTPTWTLSRALEEIVDFSRGRLDGRNTREMMRSAVQSFTRPFATTPL